MFTPTRLLPLLALLVAACQAPLPHAFTGTTRYLCCNVHYEKPKISDLNHQQGAMLPVGTPVQVTRVTRSGVVFEAPGHPPITLVLKYGRRVLSLDEYLERILLPTDPRPRLRTLPADRRRRIERAEVAPGMTRDEVLLSIGYPPAHRTPSLASPSWTYWENRWSSFVVHFDGDRVDHIQH